MTFLRNNLNYFSALILFLYVAPFIVLGQDSFVLIHDMLDHHISKYKTLAESGLIFANSNNQLDMYMNAPRVAFGNEIKFVFWLFYLFEPFNAYVINQILIRVIAFIGMLVLLNRYVFEQKNHEFSTFISLIFSLLPFYATSGISVAGLPLVTYIFLNIRAGIDSYKDWLGLVIFPLYSSLVFSMMFYIIFLGFVWFFDIYRRQLNSRFTISIFLVSFIFLIVNYRLVEAFFFGVDFTSHRVEMGIVGDSIGFFDAIIKAAKHFIIGQYHAHSLHIIFLPLVSLIFFVNIFTKNRDELFIGLFTNHS